LFDFESLVVAFSFDNGVVVERDLLDDAKIVGVVQTVISEN
jgi:hypothetical protein